MKSNNISEKDLKKYYRKIRNSLMCKVKLKNKILKDIKNEVEEYLEQNPNSFFENIIEHFGSPEAIAEEFAISSNVDYTKKSKIHRILKLSFITLLVLALIFTIATSIVIIANNKRTAGYYYEETVTDLGIVE